MTDAPPKWEKYSDTTLQRGKNIPVYHTLNLFFGIIGLSAFDFGDFIYGASWFLSTSSVKKARSIYCHYRSVYYLDRNAFCIPSMS